MVPLRRAGRSLAGVATGMLVIVRKASHELEPHAIHTDTASTTADRMLPVLL